MANEAQIRISLNIRLGTLTYQSSPTGYNADVLTNHGYTPGTILVSKYGTDVDLTQLSQPGLCIIQNLDDTNFVEYGIYDLDSPNAAFYPLGEVLPGEIYLLRLSRLLGYQLGTGSGTASGDTGLRLRFKANTAACRVKIEAFER